MRVPGFELCLPCYKSDVKVFLESVLGYEEVGWFHMTG